MGIFDKSSELRGAWPVSAFELWVRSGAEPLFGFVAGARLNQEGIDRRRQEIPKQTAQLGADAVSHAIEINDPRLLDNGEAHLATSVVKAHEHAGETGVRGEVAAEVIRIAQSVPLRDLAANPNLAPEVAGEATQIIGDANK
jgi:hypothetical protein